MSRGRAVGVAAALLLVAVVVAGGAILLRPRGGAGSVPSAPSVLRNPDSTVYTAPSGIFFEVGSATLGYGAEPVLQAIAEDVRASRLTGTVVVEGHTDDVGSDEFNLALSRARAQTVADWLVDVGRLDGSRIQVRGLGERSPAEPNDSDAHRRANRRVVIAVMRDPAATPSPAASGSATANG